MVRQLGFSQFLHCMHKRSQSEGIKVYRKAAFIESKAEVHSQEINQAGSKEKEKEKTDGNPNPKEP